MTTFSFNLTSDEDVILVNATLEGKYTFRLALDTAATHTTIDMMYSKILHYWI